MGIATDLSRVKSNITAALAAIAEKGVTVPDGSNSDALAELIASIEAGGGDYGPFSEIIAATYTPADDISSFNLPNVYYPSNGKFLLAIAFDPYSGTVTQGHFRIGITINITRVARYYSNEINEYSPRLSNDSRISINNASLQAGITYHYIFAVKEE